jgi:hypothetical protein
MRTEAEMVHSLYLPDNPWRPPDARYRRALEIIEGGGRATRLDDRPTARVLEFLRRLAHCRRDTEFAALRSKMPAMAGAFDVHRSASLQLRSTLEARFLAGEPAEAIAKKMGTTPEAVAAYEQTFFDVWTRRECVDYIVERVIGRPDPKASDDEIEAHLKKTVGYFMGAKALVEILDPRPAGGAGNSPGEPLAAVGLNLQRLKLAMALKRLDTRDPAARGALLRAAGRPTKADADGPDGATSHIEQHVNAMLQEIIWLAGRGTRSALPEALAEADELAAELRSDEMMLLATGESPEEIAQLIEELKGVDLPTLNTAPAPSAPKHDASGSTPPGP